MKRTILTILAASTILGACGNNDTKESKQESKDVSVKTNAIKDTNSLIEQAASVSKQVKSYESVYKNTVTEGKKTSNVDFSMKKDAKDNQEVNIKNSADQLQFYIYDKKTIMKQKGKWVDASTLVGTQLISQTEPLLYESQFKMLKDLKDAKFEKTSGYTLTETFNDYKKYKALFANTKENKKVIDQLEKEYPEIKGTIVVKFNDKAELESIDNKLNLSNNKTSINNDAKTTFSKINQIDALDIPKDVKAAKSVIDSENK